MTNPTSTTSPGRQVEFNIASHESWSGDGYLPQIRRGAPTAVLALSIERHKMVPKDAD